MPHLIVEYPEEQISDIEVMEILNNVHQATMSSGLFKESHIKTRAYPFKYFTLGGKKEPYLHVQAKILFGRNSEQKQRMSRCISEKLKEINLKVNVITVEVIDLDNESYSKIKISQNKE